MSKRFTDTGKWEKPWYRTLPAEEKAAWQYLTDRCDNVGVWDADFELANFMIGATIDWEGFADRCNGNVVILENGKWWLVDFCAFQHPDLDEHSKSNAVQSYVQLLKKHGLFEQYMNSTPTVGQGSWEREREREREEEQEGEDTTLLASADEVIDYLNTKAGRHYRHTESNRRGIRARLSDGYTVADCRRVVDTKVAEWQGGEMAKHLNCETLFRPSKFDKYLNQAPTKSAFTDYEKKADGTYEYKGVI